MAFTTTTLRFISVPAAVADDTGSMMLQHCANASRRILIADGGKHEGRMFKPSGLRVGSCKEIEAILEGRPRKRLANVVPLLQHCYDLRNVPLDADTQGFAEAVSIVGASRNAARVAAAAQALLDAFGGNVPDWLTSEATELHNALQHL